MIVEITTFRLLGDTNEEAFLRADERVQTEFIPNQDGFLRRTTARATDGEWAVIVLWWSEESADGCRELSARDPLVAEFDAFVDSGTVRSKRYATLD